MIRRHTRTLMVAALLVSANCARSIPPADPQFVAQWIVLERLHTRAAPAR